MMPLRTNRQRGFALLVVLWIFIILFAVGAEFSGAMRQDATATMNFAGETQSYYLATAAANRTFYHLVLARDDSRLVPGGEQEPQDEEEEEEPLVWIDGQWHREELWGAPVWVRVSDETGKIPINRVTGPILTQILVNLGVEPDEADAIGASILDWRDPDHEERVNGAEDEYYLGLAQPYEAKDARFDSLEELLLVKGVTWDLFQGGTEDFAVGLKAIFTIFSPSGQLNVAAAPPPVLQALFGLDEEDLAQIEAFRNTASGDMLQGLIESVIPDPSLQGLLDPGSEPETLRVEVQAQMPDSPVPAHVGAVIDLGDSHEGIYILRWWDQLPATEPAGGPAPQGGA